MTDTQQLKISVPPPPIVSAPGGSTPTQSNFSTPSKRGHRHKRSFAISGDFEFLKQPPATAPKPSIHTMSPEPHILSTPPPKHEQFRPNTQPAVSFVTQQHEKSDYELSYSGSGTGMNEISQRNLSPFKVPPTVAKGTNLLTPSPRFFVSEEPRFSSPCKGVPDAIINLDDVLSTTKPRSFKSHRRTESAPAFLEIVLNGNNGSAYNDAGLMIKEEDDISENNDADEEKRSVSENLSKLPTRARSQNDRTKDSSDYLPSVLLSPLRPNSPLKQYSTKYARGTNDNEIAEKTLDDGDDTTLQNEATNKYNSLKIKRQKQRYSHYTRQLPTKVAGNAIQSQTLKEQNSSTSLSSSNNSKSPLSVALTPSKNGNTPVTPASFSESNPNCNSGHNNYNNPTHITGSHSKGLDAPRFPMSPFRPYGSSTTAHYLDKGHQNYSKYRRNSAGCVSSSQTFAYQPQVYDMPENLRDCGVKLTEDEGSKRTSSPTLEDNEGEEKSISQTISNTTFDHQTDQIMDNGSRNPLSQVSSNSTTNLRSGTDSRQLSSEILLGEPGEAVDLSSLNSRTREALFGLVSLTFDDNSPSPLIAEKTGSSYASSKRYDHPQFHDNRPVTPDPNTRENRHISDGAIESKSNFSIKSTPRSSSLNKDEIHRQDPGKMRKHRSKFDKFMNMFSKK